MLGMPSVAAICPHLKVAQGGLSPSAGFPKPMASPEAFRPSPKLPELLRGAVPLAATHRGGEVESLHLGHAVLVRANGEVVASLGRPEVLIYPRSALKPIQALPLWLAGLPERYGLGLEAQAIALASHGGGPQHLAQAQAWLAAAGVGEEALVCHPREPLWAPAAEALRASGQSPTRLHQNCSGQHAMMLALAKAMGWPLAGYEKPEHPVQLWGQRLIERLGGLPDGSLTQAPDGCGIPAWRMPLKGLAQAFATLGQPGALDTAHAAACRGVVAAMQAHPHLVSDGDRLDGRLMAQPPEGGWVCKAGTEAVHAGALPSLGLGWALKVVDGTKRAVPAALRALLRQGGFPELANHPGLLEFSAPCESWPAAQPGAVP